MVVLPSQKEIPLGGSKPRARSRGGSCPPGSLQRLSEAPVPEANTCSIPWLERRTPGSRELCATATSLLDVRCCVGSVVPRGRESWKALTCPHVASSLGATLATVNGAALGCPVQESLLTIIRSLGGLGHVDCYDAPQVGLPWETPWRL